MIYSKIFQGYQGIVIDIGNRELDKPVSLRSRGPKQRKNNHKLIIPAAAYYANAHQTLQLKKKNGKKEEKIRDISAKRRSDGKLSYINSEGFSSS